MKKKGNTGDVFDLEDQQERVYLLELLLTECDSAVNRDTNEQQERGSTCVYTINQTTIVVAVVAIIIITVIKTRSSLV